MLYSDNWLGMIFYDSSADSVEEPSSADSVEEPFSADPVEEPSSADPVEEPSSAFGIIYADTSVDTHLYMSTNVEGASLNDVYSMQLSIRNILLLFLCIFVIFKFGAIIRRAVLNLIS